MVVRVIDYGEGERISMGDSSEREVGRISFRMFFRREWVWEWGIILWEGWGKVVLGKMVVCGKL